MKLKINTEVVRPDGIFALEDALGISLFRKEMIRKELEASIIDGRNMPDTMTRMAELAVDENELFYISWMMSQIVTVKLVSMGKIPVPKG